MPIETKEKNNPTLLNAGQRLKYIRSLLRLSRSYLQDNYGLPQVTLKSWENGTTPLTVSGAQRCVEAYRGEGLIVTEDWILRGVGLDPKTTATVSQYFATPSTEEMPIEDEELSMVRDANLFKESHATAVVMIVSNDDMRPEYWPGDYIGGRMRSAEKLDTAVNKDCIVYLKNGGRYFRRLIKNSSGGYNLTCLNPNEVTSEPVLYNVAIETVAPVIWHRWKDE